MKTIHNKTLRPIRIQLHGGKVLHLGSAKSGQISDEAAQEGAVQRLVKAGEIEILGEGPPAQSGGEGPGGPHEATHGHPQSTIVLPKGNR